jgi:hypothetical protein
MTTGVEDYQVPSVGVKWGNLLLAKVALVSFLYANEFIGKYLFDKINCVRAAGQKGVGGYMNRVGWRPLGRRKKNSSPECFLNPLQAVTGLTDSRAGPGWGVLSRVVRKSDRAYGAFICSTLYPPEATLAGPLTCSASLTRALYCFMVA